MSKWERLLKEEKEANYFHSVLDYVENERQLGKIIYPPKEQVFEAFRATEFDVIKVVILGQDPYHGHNQAHGLCFSVNKGIRIPPSLKNIYKELASDLNLKTPNHGNLKTWAKEGVFLLNTVLTVEASHANSHRNKGWETFTDHVIKTISEHANHVVFLLWGAPAQKKQSIIDQQKHTILTSVHPSPLSAYRGFLGCKHFSKCNEALIKHQQTPIDWQIPD